MPTYSEEVCGHVTAGECDCQKCPKCSAKIKYGLLESHLKSCVVLKHSIYMEEHPSPC